MTINAEIKMHIWKNNFHKTTALSSLNEEKAQEIDMKINEHYINSKHKDYRKLKNLEKKLCPHNTKNCACWPASYVSL